MTTESLAEKFEAARKAVMNAEAAGRSQATVRKLWKAYFAAEDALKAHAGVWA